jgi:shikimate kinase
MGINLIEFVGLPGCGKSSIPDQLFKELKAHGI